MLVADDADCATAMLLPIITPPSPPPLIRHEDELPCRYADIFMPLFRSAV